MGCCNVNTFGEVPQNQLKEVRICKTSLAPGTHNGHCEKWGTRNSECPRARQHFRVANASPDNLWQSLMNIFYKILINSLMSNWRSGRSKYVKIILPFTTRLTRFIPMTREHTSHHGIDHGIYQGLHIASVLRHLCHILGGRLWWISTGHGVLWRPNQNVTLN